MVCKFADQVYGNDWCPIGKIYCTGGNECGFNHNHQSNADRIRAMSDEELAEFLQDAKFYCQRNCEKCLRGTACISMLQWLKQPAEVDNGI